MKNILSEWKCIPNVKNKRYTLEKQVAIKRFFRNMNDIKLTSIPTKSGVNVQLQAHLEKEIRIMSYRKKQYILLPTFVHILLKMLKKKNK